MHALRRGFVAFLPALLRRTVNCGRSDFLLEGEGDARPKPLPDSEGLTPGQQVVHPRLTGRHQRG